MNFFTYFLFCIFMRTNTTSMVQNSIPEPKDSTIDDFTHREMAGIVQMYANSFIKTIMFYWDVYDLMERVAMLQLRPATFYDTREFGNFRSWGDNIQLYLSKSIFYEPMCIHLKRSYELKKQIERRYPNRPLFHRKDDPDYKNFAAYFRFYFDRKKKGTLKHLKTYFMNILANFLFKKFGFYIIDDKAYNWLEDIKSKRLMQEIIDIYNDELKNYVLHLNEFHLSLHKMTEFVIHCYEVSF